MLSNDATRASITNLRHGSLQMALMYACLKFQHFLWNIKEDTLVQIILAKILFCKSTVFLYGYSFLDFYIFYTNKKAIISVLSGI